MQVLTEQCKKVFIEKSNNIRITVENATETKAGTWTYTCLACGRNVETMPIIEDTHNGIGGFTTVYKCACGKEVVHSI